MRWVRVLRAVGRCTSVHATHESSLPLQPGPSAAWSLCCLAPWTVVPRVEQSVHSVHSIHSGPLNPLSATQSVPLSQSRGERAARPVSAWLPSAWLPSPRRRWRRRRRSRWSRAEPAMPDAFAPPLAGRAAHARCAGGSGGRQALSHGRQNCRGCPQVIERGM